MEAFTPVMSLEEDDNQKKTTQKKMSGACGWAALWTISHSPPPLSPSLSPLPSNLHTAGPLTLQLEENCHTPEAIMKILAVTTNIAWVYKGDPNAED